MSRLSDIIVETEDGRAPSPEIDQEQRVAIFDLLEANVFILPESPEGPYRLVLRRDGSRLLFDLTQEGAGEPTAFSVTLGPMQQIVKDYFQICASYYEAVKSAPPAEIEALDEARRGIHAEGARALSERLTGKAEVDNNTARRLFTLVCALNSEG